MAQVTHQNALPDSANKTDFYNLVDNSTVTGIVNADCSPSMSLVDTKLATIVTAGKVDGTAITDLAGVPSGAGALPAANLPNSIADSHLATIATAGKVSGAALTSLASVPSGAGVVPTANLGSGTANSTTILYGDQTYKASPVQTLSFVSATSISTAATTGNISLTSGNTYFVQYTFLNLSGADTLNFRFNADNGSNYKYINTGNTADSATLKTVLSTSATSIQVGRTITASNFTGIDGGFYIRQTGTGSGQTYQIWGQLSQEDNAASTIGMFSHSGKWFNTANITSFVLFTSGGATMTGTAYLYKLSLS